MAGDGWGMFEDALHLWGEFISGHPMSVGSAGRWTLPLDDVIVRMEQFESISIVFTVPGASTMFECPGREL